jgi:hypothetical protein
LNIIDPNTGLPLTSNAPSPFNISVDDQRVILLGIPLVFKKDCAFYQVEVPLVFTNPDGTLNAIDNPDDFITLEDVSFCSMLTSRTVTYQYVKDGYLWAVIPLLPSDYDPVTCKLTLKFRNFVLKLDRTVGCTRNLYKCKPFLWKLGTVDRTSITDPNPPVGTLLIGPPAK